MKQILIGKKKDLIFSLKLASMSAVLLVSSFGISFAATGDILYQNCASGSCTGAGSNNGWTRTVESSGCHSGQCLKLVGTLNTNPGAAGYGAGNTSISTKSIAGKREITVQLWEKFNKDVGAYSSGNMKAFIPYAGTGRWGTIIVPHPSGDLYVSHIIGTFVPASWYTVVTTANNKDYAINNGDGTYNSWNGYTLGHINTTPRPGTTWVKITEYLKLPTTVGGSDGVVKLWYNDKLMVDFRNASMKEYPATTFSYLTFYSSSEAKEPFEHWEDEMIIYEGYVPPSGDVTSDPTPAPAPTPTGNSLPSVPKGFQAVP